MAALWAASLRGVAGSVPACAVKDQGYVDPSVPTVNGGIEIQDAQACQNACANLVTCQVFTFYINSGGCWLQGISGEVPELQEIKGVYSAPRECPEAEAGASTNDTAPPVVGGEGEGLNGTAGGVGAVITPGDGSAAGGVADIVPGSGDGAASATGDDAITNGAATGKARGGEDTEGNGFPWLSTIIALLIVLVIAALLLGFCCMGDGSGRKKRRKSRKSEASTADASNMEDGEVSPLVASAAQRIPVPMEPIAPAPSPVNSLPMASMAMTQASSSYKMVPTVAQSPQYMRPMGQPMAYAPGMQSAGGAFTAQTLFDRLDVNHDGVVSREEFARGLGRR